MKYLLGVLLRILSIPIFILIIFISIIEVVSTVITFTVFGLFYRWIFKIDYFETPMDCSGILWNKLTKFLNKF